MRQRCKIIKSKVKKGNEEMKQIINGKIVTPEGVLEGKTLVMGERIEEIARILGGINITEAQRAAAREMIEEEINI